jgi:hypothetical protein
MNNKDGYEQNPDELPEEMLDAVNGGAIDVFLTLEGVKGESNEPPHDPPPPPKP